MDTKRYASVPVLTLADDLSSSGAYIKTTTANDWGGNALTTADFNTDYIPATIINDAKTLVEFILIDATTIGNLTTTGALIYKRGLKYYAEGDTTDSDEVTANKLAWTQGESKLLIGTNPPWMYGKFPSKENDETITGLWTFPASGSANVAVVASAANPPLLDTELTTKKYVDDTAIAGAPDATTTVKGIVEIATQAEVDAGTTTGGTGASLAVRPPELANVIQDGSYVYAADSVGTDSYAITLTPAITAYVTGQVFHFKAGTANTGASTLNVNALGAKTIKKNTDQDTETNDIESGSIITVVYDGTNFQMQTPSAGTMTTALQGQLNTGYSANVTGTNLATLTGNTTNATSLHQHNNAITLTILCSDTIEASPMSGDYRICVCEYGASSYPILGIQEKGGAGGYGPISSFKYAELRNCIYDIARLDFGGPVPGVPVSAVAFDGTYGYQSDGSGFIERNGTACTFSGTARYGGLNYDNTNSYLLVAYSTTKLAKFSISGTVLTNLNTDVTFDNTVTYTLGYVYDETNQQYFFYDATNHYVRKFNSTGVQQASLATDATISGVAKGLTKVNGQIYIVTNSCGWDARDGATVSPIISLTLVPTGIFIG